MVIVEIARQSVVIATYEFGSTAVEEGTNTDTLIISKRSMEPYCKLSVAQGIKDCV